MWDKTFMFWLRDWHNMWRRNMTSQIPKLAMKRFGQCSIELCHQNVSSVSLLKQNSNKESKYKKVFTQKMSLMFPSWQWRDLANVLSICVIKKWALFLSESKIQIRNPNPKKYLSQKLLLFCTILRFSKSCSKVVWPIFWVIKTWEIKIKNWYLPQRLFVV